MQHTFGIEEEFMLVSRDTLAPVHIADSAIQELRADGGGGTVTSEMLPSQVEHATGVCRTLTDAETEVMGFRQRLADWAERHQVLHCTVKDTHGMVLGYGTLPARASLCGASWTTSDHSSLQTARN